jgi:hypothetical protein
MKRKISAVDGNDGSLHSLSAWGWWHLRVAALTRYRTIRLAAKVAKAALAQARAAAVEWRALAV